MGHQKKEELPSTLKDENPSKPTIHQIVQDYLTKLLKDEKNEEYQDRIYYEFAMLELKKGNQDEAIEYLRKSIRSNMNNQRQKALSYYKIGQI